MINVYVDIFVNIYSFVNIYQHLVDLVASVSICKDLLTFDNMCYYLLTFFSIDEHWLKIVNNCHTRLHLQDGAMEWLYILQ